MNISLALSKTDIKKDYGLLQTWREGLLKVNLLLILIVGGFALIVNLYNFYNNDLWIPIGISILSYGSVVWVAFSPKISYEVRSHTLVWIAYAVMLMSFSIYGLSGDGRVWAIFIVIISTIFLGLRYGIAMIVINMITFIIFGYGMTTGLITPPSIETMANSTNSAGWITTGSLLIFILLILAVSVGLLIQQLNKSLLELSKSYKQMRLLTRQIINLQERERSAIARDLHDEILNMIAVFTLDLDENTSYLDVSEYIQILSGLIRRTINELRPPILNFGLYASLEELADSLEDRVENDIEILFQIPESSYRFDHEVEQHLYRIVQQACENAIRHREPKTIRIFWQINPNIVNISVKDNGIGFSVANPINVTNLVTHNHFGLTNMCERAELIGGELEIQTHLGEGTLVNLLWNSELRSNGSH